MALIRKIEGTQKKTPDRCEWENGADLVLTRAGKDVGELPPLADLAAS